MQTRRLTKNALVIVLIATVVLNGWFSLPRFRQQDDLGTTGSACGRS